MKEGALAGAVTEEAEVKAGETGPVGAMAEERAERVLKERGAAGALAVLDREEEKGGRIVAGTDVTTGAQG